MKIVSITDVRQDAASLVEYANRTHEPVLVCVRSKPAAYIVEASTYEEMERGIKQMRSKS